MSGLFTGLDLKAQLINEQTPKQQVPISQLSESCRVSRSQDQICKLILEIEQIGLDSVEAVKQYIKLTPTQYFMLTCANAIAQKRVRIRTQSRLFTNFTEVYDFQESKTFISLETTF